eukprot:Rmarinus@m.16552
MFVPRSLKKVSDNSSDLQKFNKKRKVVHVKASSPGERGCNVDSQESDSLTNAEAPIISLLNESTTGDLSDDEITKWSHDAPPWITGEPKCVVCGRLGQYVSSATEADVCSMECKTVDLRKSARENQLRALRMDSTSLRIARKDENATNVRNGQPSEPPQDFYSYDECPELSRLTAAQVCEARRRLGVNVADTAPRPVLCLSHLHLPKNILANVEASGILLPTPVQAQTWPVVLAGSDVVVVSEEGSGKTAAYVLPAVLHALRTRDRIRRSSQDTSTVDISLTMRQHNLGESDGADSDVRVLRAEKKPSVLVLTPSREECFKIEELTKTMTSGCGFRTCHVVGNDSVRTQVYRLRQGVHFIVATPGRLVSLINTCGDVDFSSINFVVIDDAHILLDRKNSFYSQVDELLGHVSPIRQTVVVCSTLPSYIRHRALQMSCEPEELSFRPAAFDSESYNGASEASTGPGTSSNPREAAAAQGNAADKTRYNGQTLAAGEYVQGPIINIPYKNGSCQQGVAGAASIGDLRLEALWVEDSQKKFRLFDMLRTQGSQPYPGPAVVIVEHSVGADMLADTIQTKTSIRTVALHGSLPKIEKDQIILSLGDRQACRIEGASWRVEVSEDVSETDLVGCVVVTPGSAKLLATISLRFVVFFDLPASVGVEELRLLTAQVSSASPNLNVFIFLNAGVGPKLSEFQRFFCRDSK